MSSVKLDEYDDTNRTSKDTATADPSSNGGSSTVVNTVVVMLIVVVVVKRILECF